jgi:hypothetical protein
MLRARWREGVFLVLLIGVAGGALLTTVAGARRSATAYDRFREATLAADVDISFDGPPTEDMAAATAAIEAIPQVEALGRAAYPFVVPAKSGMYPYLDFLALVPLDDQFNTTVDVPRVLEGRTPNPGAPLEAAVTQAFARTSGLEVGDRLAMESFAPDQMEPLFTTGDAGPPAGPAIELEIVGVVSAPLFVSDSAADFQPKLVLSRGFVDRHGDRIATYPGGYSARLRNGAADFPVVDRALRELFSDATQIEVSPSTEVDRKIDSSIDVVVTGLLLSALVAGVAGALVVGQALWRHQAQHSESSRLLSAVGMDRRSRRWAMVATTLPIAVGGAALAVVIAVLASPLTPVGIARRAEPSPGLSIDAPVVVIGFVTLILVVLGLSWIGAVSASGLRATSGRTVGAAPRGVSAVQGIGLPPSATLGASMAFDPRSGTSWAVRSALAGVGLAATAVVAAVVFAASVSGLVDDSDRYGSPFDAAVSGFTYDVVDGAELPSLHRDPSILEMGRMSTDIVRIGGAELNAHAFEPTKGDPSLTLLEGRLPANRGDVALGAQTMEDAGLDIGDTVEIHGTSGETLRAEVVGRAALPLVDERSGAGRGALLVTDDLVDISDPDLLGQDLLLRWADGTDVTDANESLEERLGAEVFAPRMPSDVKNLQEVEGFPRGLAGVLAVLGALSAVHAVASTVRRRQHDLAVLAALGFGPRSLRSVLAWQGITITLTGLAVGVPVGLALGQQAWRSVARGIGVVDDPVIPLVAVVVVVGLALVFTSAAAVAPARGARHVRPASILRRPAR